MPKDEESATKAAPGNIEHPAVTFGSVPCNGQLLKHCRETAGLTQGELAARSGFSRRLIVKAEANGTLESHTIEVIAQALCEAGVSVSARDLVADPVALTRRFLKNYATYQADCVEHSLDILASDIVVVMDGDPATNPIAGEYRGVEEFAALWKKFFSMFARAGGTLGDDPAIECVGNVVTAWGHEFVHLPELPPEAPGFVMLRITFKDGKMVRIEDYYEATGMMHALERFADQFPNAEWARQLRNKRGGEPNYQSNVPSLSAPAIVESDR